MDDDYEYDEFEEEEEDDETEVEIPVDYAKEAHRTVVKAVAPEDRVTMDDLQELELSNIIATRTQQIDSWVPGENTHGKKHFAEGDTKNKTGRQLAAMELLQNRCPLNSRRYLNDKTVETVSPNDMMKSSAILNQLQMMAYGDQIML
jgi:hypothetical protein